jgi:hypothetical protein
MARREQALRPLQVRFTEPADVEEYGDGWFTYDELAILTTSARELIEIEQQIGVALPRVLDSIRAEQVFGDLASAWIAVRASGNPVPFDRFSPMIMLADWRIRPDDETESPGKSSPPGTGGSGQPDTVSLPIMPPVESGT